MTIQTNRGLALAITDIWNDHTESTLTLEQYLTAIMSLAQDEYQMQDPLPPERFVEMLARGFATKPPPFQERWRKSSGEGRSNFPGWLGTIRSLIVDLHDMAANEQLDDPYKSFGINAPSGRRWANFYPWIFLDRATAALYGDWPWPKNHRIDESDLDETDFDYEGFLIDEEGDSDESIYRLKGLDWDELTDFLNAGRTYE